MTAPATVIVQGLSVDELIERLALRAAEVLEERAPQAADPDALLDRGGAAKFLRVSLAQLDLLSRRESDPIPYGLAGDARRFERAELLAWVRRQRGQK